MRAPWTSDDPVSQSCLCTFCRDCCTFRRTSSLADMHCALMHCRAQREEQMPSEAAKGLRQAAVHTTNLLHEVFLWVPEVKVFGGRRQIAGRPDPSI